MGREKRGQKWLQTGVSNKEKTPQDAPASTAHGFIPQAPAQQRANALHPVTPINMGIILSNGNLSASTFVWLHCG
jgi:hypothetical protein